MITKMDMYEPELLKDKDVKLDKKKIIVSDNKETDKKKEEQQQIKNEFKGVIRKR